jgi:CXXX repeat peptide maturase
MDHNVAAATKHALVILENGSVPFCYYENPYFHSSAESQWMPVRLLEGIVRRARKEQISVTFLLGKTRPPAKHERLIDSIDHAKIVSLSLEKLYPDGVLVLDADEGSLFEELSNSLDRNVILRLGKQSLKRCSALFESLTGKFKRLSIHLVGVEYFTQADFAVYADELSKIAKLLSRLYRDGQAVEVNVLTDRIMLNSMRNCDAGVKHFTVAPNGKCYICPAFYYDDESSFIGAFDGKNGFTVTRVAGADFPSAPLCTRCDAFHCKRCVFLNKKMTLELNVPSEQQCTVAHIEREASRNLLNDLGPVEPFRRLPRIAELTYSDPLELIDSPPRDVQARAVDPTTDPML